LRLKIEDRPWAGLLAHAHSGRGTWVVMSCPQIFCVSLQGDCGVWWLDHPKRQTGRYVDASWWKCVEVCRALPGSDGRYGDGGGCGPSPEPGVDGAVPGISDCGQPVLRGKQRPGVVSDRDAAGRHPD